MPLDMPEGTRVFIDATIFHYALVPTMPFSTVCIALLDRVIAGEIRATTAAFVIADVLHKVMLSEAVAKTSQPRTGLVAWLKRHPATVQGLRLPAQAALEITRLPLVLHPADMALLQDATAYCQQFGLLTNDALILAHMRRSGLTHIATNDDDFDGVPSVTAWKPR